jgi:molybdenum cofactor cytidylyltransferase
VDNDTREVRVRVTGIVLAAGTASRFGRTKQTIEVGGKPLAQHALEALVEAGVEDIVVVLGHDAEAVRRSLAVPARALVVVNDRYEEGLSTSLAAGLSAADPASEAAVVLPADQPGIRPDHLRAVLETFRTTRARIVRLRFRDAPGPSLLARDVWSDATRLTGDRGASQLIERHPDWVVEVTVDEDAPPDVDTPGDLERM